jgi:inner membrane protein
MPSPIAHSAAGYAIYKLFPEARQIFRTKLTGLTIFYFVFVANAPDLDFIAQLFTDKKIHRGLSHSLVFAIFFSLISSLVYFYFKGRKTRAFIVATFILYCSHLLLDILSPVGLPLLAPLSDSSFKFPITLFPNVHHSRGLFDPSHLIFISIETVYSILLIAFTRLAARKACKC